MSIASLWPTEQQLLSTDQLKASRSRLTPGFESLCRSMRIDDDLNEYLAGLYLPFAAWLARRHALNDGTLVVGLCGGQGSGKSTIARILSFVLASEFDLRVVGFSIDDIYKTREAREALAQTVHPLLVTRGVPLTHDVDIGITTIQRLCGQRADASTRIPAFDKALDTRVPESEWAMHTGTVDILLFDGWCVGATPQLEGELATPVNKLEREEDANAVWRGAVNRALEGEYQALFGLLDTLVLLKVPSMEQVFEWRRLQESKLRAASAERTDLAVMTDAEVDRFVMHYERLTRHILSEMPARADIVLSLDRTHNTAAIDINRPLPQTGEGQ